MAIPYCTQGDLEVALGGARILRELADPNRTGNPDAGTVQDYLESGAVEVRSAVEIRHDPETIAAMDADSVRRLRDANAALSARIAYEKGGLGMAMPEWVRERADRNDQFLTQLARGERRLGRVSGGQVAAINQPIGLVDFDTDATGISVAGFKKGFR